MFVVHKNVLLVNQISNQLVRNKMTIITLHYFEHDIHQCAKKLIFIPNVEGLEWQ